MPLTDRAVLELDHADADRTGEFHLLGVEPTEQLERSSLFGNRGQIITQLSDVAPLVPTLGEEAAGYTIDAGAGEDLLTLSFEGGPGRDDLDSQWGDGSGGTGQANATRWDATDADAITKAQILKWWARTSRTDSRNAARLYWGEWSDGTYADQAGIFDEPIDVVVRSVALTKSRDDPAVFEGTVEVIRTGSFPSFPDGDIVDVLDF